MIQCRAPFLHPYRVPANRFSREFRRLLQDFELHANFTHFNIYVCCLLVLLLFIFLFLERLLLKIADQVSLRYKALYIVQLGLYTVYNCRSYNYYDNLKVYKLCNIVVELSLFTQG
jgi:hypothetical protein